MQSDSVWRPVAPFPITHIVCICLKSRTVLFAALCICNLRYLLSEIYAEIEVDLTTFLFVWGNFARTTFLFRIESITES